MRHTCYNAGVTFLTHPRSQMSNTTTIARNLAAAARDLDAIIGRVNALIAEGVLGGIHD